MNPMGAAEGAVTRTLDLCALRHRVLAENVANANTPGYRAKQVRFDEFLEEAVVEERTDAPLRADGNSVELERENAELEKNALVHQLYMTALIQGTRQMRAAISGRGS
jgi:flagellar basal-body rod protein FlgB